MHICGDELGMIGVAMATIGAMIRPVRDCIKCQAIYLYNRMKGRN